MANSSDRISKRTLSGATPNMNGVAPERVRNSTEVKLVNLESGQKYQRLFSKDSGTRGIKSGHVLLGSGENIGEHTTGDREEVIIILKGSGDVGIDKDKILKVSANAVIYIPPVTMHDVKNTGEGILEYVFVTTQVFL